jgi:acetylornithine deacetylase/succinyl-diaminopimelate desuccinylase-like protein
MTALMATPLDHGSAHFEPSNLEFTSVDVGNQVVNLIPGEARARFNIRFNDCHSQVSLKTLILARPKADEFPFNVSSMSARSSFTAAPSIPTPDRREKFPLNIRR